MRLIACSRRLPFHVPSSRNGHAEPGPPAAGPYSHAVISNGLIFLSGQTPIDPETGKLVEGSIGDQTRRCLDNLAIVAAAAGAQLDDAVRVGIYVTDISTFKDVNEAYGTYFDDDAAGAQHDRRRRAAARRRGGDRRRPRAARLMGAVTADDVAARAAGRGDDRAAYARRCRRARSPSAPAAWWC